MLHFIRYNKIVYKFFEVCEKRNRFMKYFFLILGLLITSCVLIPDREPELPTSLSQQDRPAEPLSSNNGLGNNRLYYAQAYQDQMNKNMTRFSRVEEIENGCSKFYLGSGENRKEIILLFLPNLCDTLYKYVVQARLQCNSKGNLQFPFPAKRKNIYWMVDGQKGVTQSDSEGIMRLVFVSAKPISIDYKLTLSMNEESSEQLPNNPDIILPAEYCHERK